MMKSTSVRYDQITLKQLRMFVAIYQHATLTRAAEALFVTKAAVSQNLAELEARLGKPLFDRLKQRLVLNACGKKLLPVALEILDRCEAINDLLSDDNLLMGKLRIGASKTLGNYVLPGLLKGWLLQQPDTQLEVLIENTASLANRLAQFSIDIALVEAFVDQADVDCMPWMKDTMRVVCAPCHTLASRKQCTMADIDNQNWVLREQGSGSRTYFEEQVAGQLQQQRRVLQMNSNEAVMNSIAENLGIGLLSESGIADAVYAGRLSVVPLDQGFHRQLFIITHKSRYQGPLLLAFIRYLQEFC